VKLEGRVIPVVRTRAAGISQEQPVVNDCLATFAPLSVDNGKSIQNS
jgi:hypothetical protein